MNQHCPRAGHARHARHYKTSPALIDQRFPVSRPWQMKFFLCAVFPACFPFGNHFHDFSALQLEAFAQRWREAAGTNFQAGFHDCLLVAKCSKQLELPEQLQPDSALFKEALRVSLQLFQEHYMRDPEALHLLAAPVLVELEDYMLRQAKNSTASLALWATHDTTILVLLAALGLWDGQWPPYTDTVVLELYTRTGEIPSEPAFFRFLHHGHPLHFPWCKHSQEAPIPGLCSVKYFLPPWIAPFRDLQRLREACGAMPKPSELDEVVGSEGGIVMQAGGDRRKQDMKWVKWVRGSKSKNEAIKDIAKPNVMGLMGFLSKICEILDDLSSCLVNKKWELDRLWQGARGRAVDFAGLLLERTLWTSRSQSHALGSWCPVGMRDTGLKWWTVLGGKEGRRCLREGMTCGVEDGWVFVWLDWYIGELREDLQEFARDSLVF